MGNGTFAYETDKDESGYLVADSLERVCALFDDRYGHNWQHDPLCICALCLSDNPMRTILLEEEADENNNDVW